jgi:hypothetical protein
MKLSVSKKGGLGLSYLVFCIDYLVQRSLTNLSGGYGHVSHNLKISCSGFGTMDNI